MRACVAGREETQDSLSCVCRLQKRLTVTNVPCQKKTRLYTTKNADRPPTESMEGHRYSLKEKEGDVAHSACIISGLQKGPAERGHVKKHQNSSKVSKSFSTLFDNFRAGQKTSKFVKKRQKVFRHFFDTFRAAPFYGPFWGALT